MPPHTSTSASPETLTSTQSLYPATSPRRPSHSMNTTSPPQPAMSREQSQDNIGVPVRHPRPLTAAELHLELEKEQEAVVNRLTRELTALRQHSASVTSTTSNSTTTSTSVFEPSVTENYIGPTIPTSSRRHRSSSNLSSSSSRSNPAPIPVTTPGVNVPPTSGTSQASFDRARDAAGLPPGTAHIPSSRSRQNSTVLPYRSGAPSPSLSMHQHHAGDTTSPYFSHRASMSSMNGAGGGTGTTPARSPSVSSPRYEEAAHARAVLESARSENEMLIERIKELEREVRRRASEHKSEGSLEAPSSRGQGVSA